MVRDPGVILEATTATAQHDMEKLAPSRFTKLDENTEKVVLFKGGTSANQGKEQRHYSCAYPV